PEFDAIPEYAPLPKSGGRGPGIGEELDKCKAVDILDKDIAVVGFMVIPNKFKDDPTPNSGPPEVTMIEVMDAQGDHFYFVHGSSVLMAQLEERHGNDQIPFRTRLTKAMSKNDREYYTFV
ncbi:unnamed protein product, partial [marine sediment metagenome]